MKERGGSQGELLSVAISERKKVLKGENPKSYTSVSERAGNAQ